MTAPTENEDWIVERGGDVVEKKARSGLPSLDDLEHLVYCLWVADYMMRNAGDLANSEDMYPAFQNEAAIRARKLGLPLTAQAFSLPPEQFQAQFFDKFDAICNEIKAFSAPRPGR
jgi:hypothetical protein